MLAKAHKFVLFFFVRKVFLEILQALIVLLLSTLRCITFRRRVANLFGSRKYAQLIAVLIGLRIGRVEGGVY